MLQENDEQLTFWNAETLEEGADVSDEEPPDFSYAEMVGETALTVVLEGDLDLCVAPTLRQSLDGAIGRLEARPLLVFDMRGVSYVDSAGLALLVETQRRLPEKAKIGLLVEKGSQPDRVLHLGRFETFLTLARTPEELMV